MKAPEKTPRKPYGKTVGQMLQENPDFMTALAWKTAPPELPKRDSLLDAFTESPLLPCPGLSELVTEWKLTAEKARAVYESWIHAKRKLRKLRIQNKLAPKKKNELLGFIRHEYWLRSGILPTGQNLKILAEEIESLESEGFNVTNADAETILSGPLHVKDKSVRIWLIDYWIKQENESTPPLCLCSDKELDRLAQRKQVALPRSENCDSEWACPPGGQTMRKIISVLRLLRVTSPALPEEQEIPPLRRKRGIPLCVKPLSKRTSR